MAQAWSLAIDFGTSNTAAAHTAPFTGEVATLSIEHRSTTIPSAVYMDAPKHFIVGDAAFDAGSSAVDSFIETPKSFVPEGLLNFAGRTVTVDRPIAAILSYVVERGMQEHDGNRPSMLVLTHPERWSEREKQVLVDAAVSIGFSNEDIYLISEPVAAVRFFSDKAPIKPGQKYAVFDFGAGTLDVAVLEAKEDGQYAVIAGDGRNSLGGQSFDAAIRLWVDEQLEDEDPDLLAYLASAPRSEVFRLMTSICRAKEVHSKSESADIYFRGHGFEQKLTITRDEFEGLILPKVQEAVELMRGALLRAGITDRSQLEALYMTGGSSAIPLMRSELSKLGPVAHIDNPKTVVVRGALNAALEDATRAAAASSWVSEENESTVKNEMNSTVAEGSQPAATDEESSGAMNDKHRAVLPISQVDRDSTAETPAADTAALQTADAKPKRLGKAKAVGGVIAGVIVIAGAIVAVSMMNSGGSDYTPIASPTTTEDHSPTTTAGLQESSAPPSTDQQEPKVLTSQADIQELIADYFGNRVTGLSTEIDNCEVDDENEATCELKADSSLISLVRLDGSTSGFVYIWSDDSLVEGYAEEGDIDEGESGSYQRRNPEREVGFAVIPAQKSDGLYVLVLWDELRGGVMQFQYSPDREMLIKKGEEWTGL